MKMINNVAMQTGNSFTSLDSIYGNKIDTCLVNEWSNEEQDKLEEGLDNLRISQELSEFKEILKCKGCYDRPKEVVITKCYHLFCNPCVQKLMVTRQRKCPTCSSSFGPNDIKPIYI